MNEARDTSGIITLLSDFGLRDPYVGVMKGVILGRFREAAVVDLTHGIAQQDVCEGEFWLEHAHYWFPKGTVHVAVVDPGVGTDRQCIAAHADDHYFVAPDNGLLGGVLQSAAQVEVRRLELDRLDLVPASRTFHGRDVFAPAGALLAAGRRSFRELGPVCSWVPSPRPRPKLTATGVCGNVATIDHFGNLITNIEVKSCPKERGATLRVAGLDLPIFGTFGEASIGQPFAYQGSFGTWEIAVRNGSATRDLGLGRGAPVEIHWA